MKITFCGAAGEVTGSQHLVEWGKEKVLLDCGLFQGRRAEARRNNETFAYAPSNLDLVVLSHAHMDHCGNLPSLVRTGYRGPVYCTPATADVAEIMLQDAIRIQQEDARYLNLHRAAGLKPIEPLYDERHVRALVKQFEPVPYDQWSQVLPTLRIRFRDAGHILGSAITELEFQELGEIRRMVFTGDLGRRGLPLLRDPTLVNGCDVLITESTYGNRVHPPASDLKAQLLRIILQAVEQQGRVIIPAFSLGRTQQVVYFLNELVNEQKLPPIPVFVDSPLSNRLTEVYRHYASEMGTDIEQMLHSDVDPFGFRGLTYVTTPQESMSLNYRKGAFVVIAASGMCESGRVLHHLKHAAADERNTIVIIGFQAEHTLGRRIVERQAHLRILDRDITLRARVEVLNGLSGHADIHDFKWWFEHMAATTGIGHAFIVHGEPPAAQGLATLLRDYCDEDPVIPGPRQSFEV